MRKKLFKSFVELTGSRIISKGLRVFTQSRLSKPLVRPFVNTYQINESEMEKPLKDYHSIHELFTRNLKPGLRPVHEDTSALVSPVDGLLSQSGVIQKDLSLPIKNELYNVQTILGNEKLAERFQNGHYFLFYLSPKDYHRIHYPVDGTVTARWALGNKSYPVNEIGTKWGDKPFQTNYRIISLLQANKTKIAFIKIGALNINSIALTHQSKTFAQGDEAGYFTFGSSVLLLIEDEKSQPFMPIKQFTQSVKYGEKIGYWI